MLAASSVSGEAARYRARQARRHQQPRRKKRSALLWTAARLAAFGVPLGLEPVRGMLAPSVIKRFTASAPGCPARRAARCPPTWTLARRIVPALAPADAALPERQGAYGRRR